MTAAELLQAVPDFGTYPCQLSADVCKDLLPETCISLLVACTTPNTLVAWPCPYYSTRHSKLSLVAGPTTTIAQKNEATYEGKQHQTTTHHRSLLLRRRPRANLLPKFLSTALDLGRVCIVSCAREPATWKAAWKEQNAVLLLPLAAYPRELIRGAGSEAYILSPPALGCCCYAVSSPTRRGRAASSRISC